MVATSRWLADRGAPVALRLLLLVVLFPALAVAQAPVDAGVPDARVDAPANAPPGDGGVPPADAQPQFDPPKAIGATDVPYPANAPAHDVPIVVTVKLLVDVTGAVAKVDPITPV